MAHERSEGLESSIEKETFGAALSLIRKCFPLHDPNIRSSVLYTSDIPDEVEHKSNSPYHWLHVQAVHE